MTNYVTLDAARCALIVSGKPKVLQAKTWQVLSILMERAPDIVSRAEIIDAVWPGHHATGDKGINQALWAIRAALGDDPKDPKFVRTLPRQGYQWIDSARTHNTSRLRSIVQRSLGQLTGISTLVIVVLTVVFLTSSSHSISGDFNNGASAPVVATSAYRLNNDIVVELAGGCRGVLKNQSNSDIGEPVLSLDGSRVAFTLRENDSCRLVTVELSDGKRNDFGECPTDVI